MLRCKNGHEVDASWKLCPQCGQDLQKDPPQPKPVDPTEIEALTKRIEKLEKKLAEVEAALKKKADQEHTHTLSEILNMKL